MTQVCPPTMIGVQTLSSHPGVCDCPGLRGTSLSLVLVRQRLTVVPAPAEPGYDGALFYRSHS